MPQRVPSDHPLARTFALLDPDLAPGAAASLQGTTNLTEIVGLVELLVNPQATAAGCSAALRSLEHDTSELVSDAVVRALANQFPTIRIAACAEIVRRGVFTLAADSLESLIRTDAFWQVRKAAVNALGTDSTDRRWGVLFAATDPHWRVRYSLAQVLVEWGSDETARAKVLEHLLEANAKVARLRDYLLFRWTGAMPPERRNENPAEWCSFWDWDPAVLARHISELGRDGRRDSLPILTRLVNHPDERIRDWVIQTLRDDGKPQHWADAFSQLGDPREDITPLQADLVKGLELDRLEAVSRFILAQEKPHPRAGVGDPAVKGGRVPCPGSSRRFGTARPRSHSGGEPRPARQETHR
ncbi:MAG: HEAT repeat domain-containing protein [Gemmataceae bacterium]